MDLVFGRFIKELSGYTTNYSVNKKFTDRGILKEVELTIMNCSDKLFSALTALSNKVNINDSQIKYDMEETILHKRSNKKNGSVTFVITKDNYALFLNKILNRLRDEKDRNTSF